MTIPKPVCEALNIEEGDTLQVGLTDGSMIVIVKKREEVSK